MEAKELMINDLVKAKGYSGIIRVDADTMYVIENGNRTPYFNKDDIIPIELSEEILKVNGFRLVKDAESNYCGGIIKNKDITIWVHLGDRYNYHTRITNHKILVTESVSIKLAIRYVHELQHALRLCGLTDLADNFQI